MSNDNEIIPKLIAEKQVIYRPSLRLVTNSVTGAILLHQIMFWWYRKGSKPFYKFFQPCSHKLYRPGDSWTEELGFSNAEVQTGLKSFAKKIVAGVSLNECAEVYSVVYWTDKKRVTWYQFNPVTFELLYNSRFSNYISNSGISNYKVIDDSEITLTEINTKNTHKGHSESGAFADLPPEERAFWEQKEQERQQAQKAAKEKRQRRGTLQALENHEQQKNKVDVSWLDERQRPLATAFLDAMGEEYVILKKERSLWRKEVNVWLDLKLTPQDIISTIRIMRNDGLTIGGPQSLTKIARDKKSEKSSTGIKARDILPVVIAPTRPLVKG